MIGILSTLLGSVIPQIANLFKDGFKLKQDALDKKQELEILKLQIEANKIQAQIDKEIKAEEITARIDESINNFLIEQNKSNVERSKIKTGIKWLDSLDTLIRSFIGLVCSTLLAVTAIQALKMAVPLWTITPLWSIIELSIGFYVGYHGSAMSQKKVNK